MVPFPTKGTVLPAPVVLTTGVGSHARAPCATAVHRVEPTATDQSCLESVSETPNNSECRLVPKHGDVRAVNVLAHFPYHFDIDDGGSMHADETTGVERPVEGAESYIVVSRTLTRPPQDSQDL